MSFLKPNLTLQLPERLWHGSAFATEQLKPSYMWTKKLVEWPATGESNHYLYACTDKELAISFGLMAALSRQYVLRRFKVYGRDTILIESGFHITHLDLEQLSVWLYELRPSNSEQWVYNHNAPESNDSDFKTHRTVPWESREPVNLARWLGKKDVNIRKV